MRHSDETPPGGAGPDDDYLDGLCDLEADQGPPLADADLPWFVLFAGVDPTDRVALEHRAAQWRALFLWSSSGGGR